MPKRERHTATGLPKPGIIFLIPQSDGLATLAALGPEWPVLPGIFTAVLFDVVLDPKFDHSPAAESRAQLAIAGAKVLASISVFSHAFRDGRWAVVGAIEVDALLPFVRKEPFDQTGVGPEILSVPLVQALVEGARGLAPWNPSAPHNPDHVRKHLYKTVRAKHPLAFSGDYPTVPPRENTEDKFGALVSVVLPTALGAMDRAQRYERPIQEILASEELGSVCGGGTQLAGCGLYGEVIVPFSSIDIEACDLEIVLQRLRIALPSLDVPVGTQLHYSSDDGIWLDEFDGIDWKVKLPRVLSH